MRTGVVAIIYAEPEWQNTKRCIQQLKLPTVYVDRDGVGSMAKAYNRGFNKLIELYPDLEFVWMISNVRFNPYILKIMEKSMEGFDCLHPSFNSDHPFAQPTFIKGVKEVPFVEFTAPLIRVETFKKFPLDEQMPYWGHDLDWGYRVRQAGGKVGVHHDVTVQHEYIRFKAKRKPLPVTKERQRLRKETNAGTRARLAELYGDNWGQVLESQIH